MKTNFYLFFAIFFSLNAVHGQDSTTVSPQMAYTYIENFGEAVRASIPGRYICQVPCAWLMQTSNIRTLIDDNNQVRVYMGLKSQVDTIFNEVDTLYDTLQSIQLMMVAVDANGNDIIPANDVRIANLMHPCPNTCSTESPMYLAYCRGLNKNPNTGEPDNACGCCGWGSSCNLEESNASATSRGNDQLQRPIAFPLLVP